jgi:hypothetical protein
MFGIGGILHWVIGAAVAVWYISNHPEKYEWIIKLFQ